MKKLLIGLITLTVIIVPLIMTVMVYYIGQLIYGLNLWLKLILYPLLIITTLLSPLFIFVKIEEFFDQIKNHPFGVFTRGYMIGYMFAIFAMLLMGLLMMLILTAERPIFDIKIEESNKLLFFIIFEGVVLVLTIIQFFRLRKSNKSK